jgi:aldehyde dehydrogenase (NAD+)
VADLLENHGGTVVHGGGSYPAERRHDLTIVVDPALDSRLMTEEIFGPLLPVVSVDGLEPAIAHIKHGTKPLAAYVFSRSKRVIDRYRSAVSAGAVVSNHAAVHFLVPALPFGGVGTSGMGSYHGEFGFHTFSHRKAHLSRPTKVDPRVVYPPYGPRTQRLLRKIF